MGSNGQFSKSKDWLFYWSPINVTLCAWDVVNAPWGGDHAKSYWDGEINVPLIQWNSHQIAVIDKIYIDGFVQDCVHNLSAWLLYL